MEQYITIDEVAKLWRPLTSAEQERAEALIPVIGAMFRLKARDRGKELDTMMELDEDYALIVKSAIVDVVAYNMALGSDSANGSVSQLTESALGYSQTVSYATPKSDDLYIPQSTWKKLGLKKQRYGSMEVY